MRREQGLCQANDSEGISHVCLYPVSWGVSTARPFVGHELADKRGLVRVSTICPIIAIGPGRGESLVWQWQLQENAKPNLKHYFCWFPRLGMDGMIRRNRMRNFHIL